MRIFLLRALIHLAFFIPPALHAEETEKNEAFSLTNRLSKKGKPSSIRYLNSLPIIHWKFYGGIGTATYGGLLTGRNIINSNNNIFMSMQASQALTLGVAYKVHDRFFLKAEFSYCSIKGKESNVIMVTNHRTHPYEFRADNFDLVVLGQLNILPYTYLPRKKINVVPYVVVGFGLTSNNAKGMYNGRWESLNTLSNHQIKNNVLAIVPVGLGLIYRRNSQWDIGLDATVRYTLAGSLDGLAQDGISTSSLSPDGKAYYDQYYKLNTAIIQKDHHTFNDLYTLVQVRIQYTIIPEKIKHLFIQKDLNFSDKPRGRYGK